MATGGIVSPLDVTEDRHPDLVLLPPDDLVRTMAPDQTDPNATCASSSQLLLRGVATTI
jgi:hypothetical protein